MANRIDNTGARTQTPLTTQEQAQFTAFKATPLGASYLNGLDGAQTYARLRASMAFDNPDPQGTTAVDSIPKQELELAFGAVLGAVLMLNTADSTVNSVSHMTNAQFQAIFQAKLTFLQATTVDPIPNNAALQSDIANCVAHGIITQDQSNELLTTQDAGYASVLQTGPVALLAFGALVFPTLDDLTALGID